MERRREYYRSPDHRQATAAWPVDSAFACHKNRSGGRGCHTGDRDRVHERHARCRVDSVREVRSPCASPRSPRSSCATRWPRRWPTPSTTCLSATCLLVQITTDDGLVGLGECAAYGGSLDSMERVVLDDLQPSLIGEDPFQVERLWSRMARRSHQRGTTGHADAGDQRGRHRALGPHRPGHADARSTGCSAAIGTRSTPMPRPGSTPETRIWPSWPKRSAATPNAGFARSR